MPITIRQSARIILLDHENLVLLIRFVVQRDSKPFVFWATPGGGVEEGETHAEAARRELAEELHLSIPLAGPVHTTVDRFEHEGTLVENTDVFFVGRCDQSAPRLDALTDAERGAMKELKWWSVAELEQTSQRVFPPGITTVIRSIVGMNR